MTDDSTSDIGGYLRDIALADCTFGETPKENINMSTEPTAKKTAIPEKLNHVVLQTCMRQKMPPIELTDGKWKDLLLFQNLYVDTKGTKQLKNTDSMGAIPMNYFLGIPHEENKYIDPLDATFTGDCVADYTHIKINKLGVACKNFVCLVERDASGGIQIMDNLIFEVRRLYQTSPNTEVNDGIPENSVTQVLSDLTNGLAIDIPMFSVGFLNKSDLVYDIAVTEANVKQNYNAYYYLSHMVSNGNLDNALMIPEYPFWHYQIRCINFPAGVSNVKLVLSYIIELYANIEGVNRNFKTKTKYLPYYGSLSQNQTEAGTLCEAISKKRKIKQENCED